MCPKFNEHFKKYNQMYSFGFLLIITLLVAFLFLRIDALETDIDKFVNEPSVNHQLTKDMIEREAKTATIKTEVTVSNEVAPPEPPHAQPGVVVPGGFAPAGMTPPTGNLPPNQ